MQCVSLVNKYTYKICVIEVSRKQFKPCRLLDLLPGDSWCGNTKCICRCMCHVSNLKQTNVKRSKDGMNYHSLFSNPVVKVSHDCSLQRKKLSPFLACSENC